MKNTSIIDNKYDIVSYQFFVIINATRVRYKKS